MKNYSVLLLTAIILMMAACGDSEFTVTNDLQYPIITIDFCSADSSEEDFLWLIIIDPGDSATNPNVDRGRYNLEAMALDGYLYVKRNVNITSGESSWTITSSQRGERY